MTYFLKRFKPHQKYSLEKFSTTNAEQSEADTHRVGEDYEEAKQKQKEANEKIRQGDPNPLGDWRSGMGTTLNLDEDEWE